MKLSRLIVITLFLFLFTASKAQRCYYRSFQDLDSGRSVEADFRMQRLSVRKLRRHLGPEYRLKCGLHTKRKILKSALFVQVMAKIRSCYFLFEADPSDARIVDTRYMRYLLARYPNLQDEYMKLDPASREDPIIIWQYLRQIK